MAKLSKHDITYAVNATVGDDLTEEVAAYIIEAEHQDGEAYWDNFKTVQEVVEDFLLYREG